MQKLSIRKISLLGLVLMAASAVTAAVLPKSDNQSDKFAAGSLTQNSGGGASSWTCAADTAGGGIQNGACNHSTADGSETSEVDDSASNSSLPADGGLGQNNTSDAS